MYKEFYTGNPDLNWGKLQSYQGRGVRGQALQLEAGFICRYCQAHVHNLIMLSGVHNRNHCPVCLWSRHVDMLRPGDRLSACKASMQPIGLTVKQCRDKYGHLKAGELMLIHCCSECGKLSINRIAADDLPESLMEIFWASEKLDLRTQHQLETSGIHLLKGKDMKLVVSRLHGIMSV